MRSAATRSVRVLGLLLGIVIVPGMVGCKKEMPTVAGKVTLDSQPLANGTIQFMPTDGASASAGGPIKDGAYSLEVPPGPKTVWISATKVVGKRVVYEGDPKSPVMDVVQEIIPRQYNAASKLSVSVTEGQNTHNFDLVTKQ